MDELLAVIDAGEALSEVIPLVHVDLAGELAAVKLRFSSSVIYITVNPDDDSLTVGRSAPVDLSERKTISNWPPWDRACGRSIMRAWRLTNHQGYEDGIQLAFADEGKGVEAVTIQLVGIASTIELSAVEPQSNPKLFLGNAQG